LMWLMLDSWISSWRGNWSKLGSVVCVQVMWYLRHMYSDNIIYYAANSSFNSYAWLCQVLVYVYVKYHLIYLPNATS
jgi:hypothetical protein